MFSSSVVKVRARVKFSIIVGSVFRLCCRLYSFRRLVN